MAGRKAAAQAPVAPVAPATTTAPPVTDPTNPQVQTPVAPDLESTAATQGTTPGDSAQAPAGVSPAEWASVRAWLAQKTGAQLPDDFEETAFLDELFQGSDARTALAQKERELAALRAKYSAAPSTPADGQPPSAATPARPGVVPTTTSSIPKWNPEWDDLPRDPETGAIVADPETLRQIRRFHQFTQRAIPDALEKLSNIDQLIEDRLKAATEQATKYTQDQLESARIGDQFNAFVMNTPGLLLTGPQGPVKYGDQYRLTPLGEHVHDIIDHLVAEGLSESKAKQFAMRYGIPPQAQPSHPSQPSMFLRQNQAPVPPAAPAPAAPPARTPILPPTTRSSRSEKKYAGLSGVEIMRAKAAEKGLT